MSTSTRTFQFKINRGPSADRIFDSVRYAFDPKVKCNAEFKVQIGDDGFVYDGTVYPLITSVESVSSTELLLEGFWYYDDGSHVYLPYSQSCGTDERGNLVNPEPSDLVGRRFWGSYKHQTRTGKFNVER